MMSEIFVSQADLLLRMLVDGCCFGLLYDVIRGFRRAFGHRNIWIAVEDFVFACVTLFQIIYLVQVYFVGNIRFFVFFGLIGGIIIYLYTISSVWIFLIYHILLIVKKCSKNIKKMLKKVAKTVNIMVNLEKYRKHEK